MPEDNNKLYTRTVLTEKVKISSYIELPCFNPNKVGLSEGSSFWLGLWDGEFWSYFKKD